MNLIIENLVSIIFMSFIPLNSFLFRSNKYILFKCFNYFDEPLWSIIYYLMQSLAIQWEFPCNYFSVVMVNLEEIWSFSFLVTLWMFPWRTSSCRLLFLFFDCLGKLPRKCSWDQKKWWEAQQHIIQKRPGLLCRPNEKCIHPSFPSAEK